MSKYEVKNAWTLGGKKRHVIVNTEIGMYAYFCGYDFMGSAVWMSDINGAYLMKTAEEAEQIVKDLEAAD